VRVSVPLQVLASTCSGTDTRTLTVTY